MPTAASRRPRRAYDHRLREHVLRTGAIAHARALGVPRSTIATWKARGPRRVVTLDLPVVDHEALARRAARLERRVVVLATVVRLLLTLARVSRFHLARARLPEGAAKARLLNAIGRAEDVLPRASVLRIVGLSPSRFHAWRRQRQPCGLEDRPSCPRRSPQQLTRTEVATIRSLVLDPRQRHMPLRTLCLWAQRTGRVFASVTTWLRLVREHGWRRPRLRVHPARPTIGVRASGPNEYWHIDVTVIKLLDGSRAYLHAVIDNYSRRILAWLLNDRLDPLATCHVLIEASKQLGPDAATTVVCDGGGENVNRAVDATLDFASLRRVLAQVDVSYSNSLIEAWWRSLKHQWLFLHHLDTPASLRKLCAFYVKAHNTQMPHAAFRGQTPDEVYFGSGAHVVDDLAIARRAAFQNRIATNRAVRCHLCANTPTAPPGLPIIS